MTYTAETITIHPNMEKEDLEVNIGLKNLKFKIFGPKKRHIYLFLAPRRHVLATNSVQVLKIYPVKAIKIHPNWDESSMEGDICLIELESPFALNSAVGSARSCQIIC